MNWITAAMVVGAASFAGALGCSSSDSPSGGTGGTQAGASGSPGSSTGGSSTGGSSAGGSSVGAGSVACQTYCTCLAQNCATQAIPGGLSCADFCAAMTTDQLTCRQVMCNNAPAQPNNDHCDHAVGINECL